MAAHRDLVRFLSLLFLFVTPLFVFFSLLSFQSLFSFLPFHHTRPTRYLVFVLLYLI